MSEQPRRAYEMTFKIGADTYKDMLHAMQNFIDMMEREYPDLEVNHHGVSGGYSDGYSYDITIRPEMTHDRYFEAVNVWLDKREQPATPSEDATP